MNEALGISANIGLSVIFFLIAGGLLLLVAGILITYICATKNLFVRKHKTWNFIVKIYYLFIPIGFAFIGCIMGGLFGLKKSIGLSIDNHSKAIIELSTYYMSDFQVYLNNNLDSIQVAGYSVDKVVDDFFEADKTSIKLGFLSGLQNKLSKWIFTGAVEGLMAYSAYKIGVKQSSLKESFQLLSEFEIKKTDAALSKILLATIKKQLDSFFKAMYINQIINLLLILLFPISETIIYFFYFQNRILKPTTEIR